jgi:cytochrome c oxidase subunit 2
MVYNMGGLVFILPAHGAQVDNLNEYYVGCLIFLFRQSTQVLLHYFAFKYREVKKGKRLILLDNNKLEVIGVYSALFWQVLFFMDCMLGQTLCLLMMRCRYRVICTTASNGTASYAGEDNVLGKANVRYIEGTNVVGVDLSDPCTR